MNGIGLIDSSLGKAAGGAALAVLSIKTSVTGIGLMKIPTAAFLITSSYSDFMQGNRLMPTVNGMSITFYNGNDMAYHLSTNAAAMISTLGLALVQLKPNPAIAGETDDITKKAAMQVDDAVESSSKTVKELISESDAAKKWGILDDGTNQEIKHFSDYWKQYPERIPSLEQRLGVQEGYFNNSLEGFNNFTSEAECVVSEATSTGNVRNINGKSIYYIDGVANTKKGVIVIMRDGKIQSMMPSDFKSFNKMQ